MREEKNVPLEPYHGRDPISPERMTIVLTHLYLANGLGSFSLEAVKVINWLASKELSRRVFPVSL